MRAQAAVVAQIENFVKYPPRQKPASFNLEGVMEKMRNATDGGCFIAKNQ